MTNTHQQVPSRARLAPTAQQAVESAEFEDDEEEFDLDDSDEEGSENSDDENFIGILDSTLRLVQLGALRSVCVFLSFSRFSRARSLSLYLACDVW